MEVKVKSVGSIYKNNYQPDKTAIFFKDTVISFRELDDQVLAYANLLKSKGIVKGDKVIMNTLNSPEFLYTYLGTVRNGAVIVPVNPSFTLPEMKMIASDSDAKMLVIHEGVMMKLGMERAALASELGVDVLVLDADFRAEVAAAAREDYDLVTDENEVSTFLYTSGTTGLPKAAMLTHRNLVSNTWQCTVGVGTLPEDIFMCVLPMFHVFAFTACILMPLFLGATVDIVETFAPKVVINNLLEREISIFMGVPAMYMLLIEAGKKNVRFPKLRRAVSGGAALPVEVYFQAKDSINLPIIEGYGLTEASPGSAFNPYDGVQKPGSIGLPLIDIDAKIVDPDGKVLPAGEVGELILRGPNVMLGYYKRPEETAEALKDGWLHTGDLAKMDEEGYIYIVDRIKDLVIVAGLNVYPREIEEVLYQCPKIKDAAVIGVKNKLRGEAVVAYVVLKDGESADKKEIHQWMEERLAVYKIPKQIVFKEDLPRNNTGKILKRVLKEMAESGE